MLTVQVNFPAHVIVEGFGNSVGLLAPVGGNVMLEAHVAHVFEQGLEIRDFHDPVPAERLEGIVRQIPFADVGPDFARRVERVHAAEGEDSAAQAPDDGAAVPLPRYQTKLGVMTILEMNVARIKRKYEQMGLA